MYVCMYVCMYDTLWMNCSRGMVNPQPTVLSRKEFIGKSLKNGCALRKFSTCFIFQENAKKDTAKVRLNQNDS